MKSKFFPYFYNVKSKNQNQKAYSEIYQHITIFETELFKGENQVHTVYSVHSFKTFKPMISKPCTKQNSKKSSSYITSLFRLAP